MRERVSVFYTEKFPHQKFPFMCIRLRLISDQNETIPYYNNIQFGTYRCIHANVNSVCSIVGENSYINRYAIVQLASKRAYQIVVVVAVATVVMVVVAAAVAAAAIPSTSAVV